MKIESYQGFGNKNYNIMTYKFFQQLEYTSVWRM